MVWSTGLILDVREDEWADIGLDCCILGCYSQRGLFYLENVLFFVTAAGCGGEGFLDIRCLTSSTYCFAVSGCGFLSHDLFDANHLYSKDFPDDLTSEIRADGKYPRMPSACCLA